MKKIFASLLVLSSASAFASNGTVICKIFDGSNRVVARISQAESSNTNTHFGYVTVRGMSNMVYGFSVSTTVNGVESQHHGSREVVVVKYINNQLAGMMICERDL